MFGLSRRDVWSLYLGMALQGMVLSVAMNSRFLFLLNAVLTAFDWYMLQGIINKDKTEK